MVTRRSGPTSRSGMEAMVSTVRPKEAARYFALSGSLWPVPSHPGHWPVPAQLVHWPPLPVPLHMVHWPDAPHTSHFTSCSVTKDCGARLGPSRGRELRGRGGRTQAGARRYRRVMKALVKSARQPGLWLEDVAPPEIGINDVLIRVLKTGICGTDVHIYKWDEWAQETIPVPMAIGHEFVGRIEAVGSNVADFFPGDMVSGEGHVVCGRCRNCFAGRRHLCAHAMGVGVNRPGAFAEYIALPMTNIWRHHEGIDLDVAAIFDPFGNAVHTALSFPVLGEDVLVTGAGPIGIMAAAVARHAGARFTVITDLNPYRLALAEKLGVTLAVNVR